MQLNWLKLEGFRNYPDLDIDLTESPVLALVGPNAQGKTNLLESIAFLALGKSFRSRKALETLGWDRPHGRIKGEMAQDGKTIELEVFLQRSPDMKKLKRQGQIVKPKDFLGNLKVVIFTPEHLQMITGSPRLRRQFMDRVLVQLDHSYVMALGTYQSVLKQRNALLKQIQFKRAQQWELEMWDVRLVQEAERLWEKREALMTFVSKEVGDLYRSIAQTEDKLTLRYGPDKERFEERLVAHMDADLRSGSTSIGPHRDDFTLMLNGRSLSEFGSRGECRSGVLALKIAQIHYIEKACGHKPLLLLDDVFSELDSQRQLHLGDLLKNYQAVITTTSLDHVKGLNAASIYLVNGGELTKYLPQNVDKEVESQSE
ncbi:MAG: DNA replication and repair protein RecF [Oceanicoccus sp.]|jgi:DNA replication and repair protein RecF